MRTTGWAVVGALVAVATAAACASGKAATAPAGRSRPRTTPSADSSGTTSSPTTWRRPRSSTRRCWAGSSSRRPATGALPHRAVRGPVHRRHRPAPRGEDRTRDLARVPVGRRPRPRGRAGDVRRRQAPLSSDRGRRLRPRRRGARPPGRAARPRRRDRHAGDGAGPAAPPPIFLDGAPREGRPGCARLLQGPRGIRQQRLAERARHRLSRAEAAALARRSAADPPGSEGVQPNWLPYVRVEDPSALAAKVVSLGGRVAIAPRPDIRNGTLAIVIDPRGAALALQKWPL